MRPPALPLRLKGICTVCLVALYSASTALATPASLFQGLGIFDMSYSFRMDEEVNSQKMKHVFMAGSAVENIQLASISGNGYSAASSQGPLDAVAVSFGNSGQLIGYVYRAHAAAVPPSPAFGPSSVTTKVGNPSDQAYHYSRDLENSLWWAEPA